jgi:hypothetical protein
MMPPVDLEWCPSARAIVCLRVLQTDDALLKSRSRFERARQTERGSAPYFNASVEQANERLPPR